MKHRRPIRATIIAAGVLAFAAPAAVASPAADAITGAQAAIETKLAWVGGMLTRAEAILAVTDAADAALAGLGAADAGGEATAAGEGAALAGEGAAAAAADGIETALDAVTGNDTDDDATAVEVLETIQEVIEAGVGNIPDGLPEPPAGRP